MKIQQAFNLERMTAVTVDPGQTVAELSRQLTRENKGLAVVCDPEVNVLGVISVMDIVRALGEHGGDVAALSVGDVMNPKITVCNGGDEVADVLDIMNIRRIRHIPVVEEGKLKGLIDIRDLLKYRFDEAELKAEEMHHYMFGTGYR
ncbi:MAG: CBS domain-containing protein [Rhodospirillales bacterium]|nr:CBS domain-containing protein [Rhodospirillales bacterium]